MAAQKRLTKEYADLVKITTDANSSIHSVSTDDSNFFHWEALLLPKNAPYNKGAFRINLDFPAEYPFKPPKVTFKTKIYHPNIDKGGAVCLEVLKTDVWKPTTKVEHVLTGLAGLLDAPNPADPLEADIAELFTTDVKKFNKTAEEHCKKHAEKRPKK